MIGDVWTVEGRHLAQTFAKKYKKVFAFKEDYRGRFFILVECNIYLRCARSVYMLVAWLTGCLALHYVP